MRENEGDSGDGWPRPHIDPPEGGSPWPQRDADLDPRDGGGPRPRGSRRHGHTALYLAVAVLAAGVGAGLTAAFTGHGTRSSAGISVGDVPSPHDSAGGRSPLDQAAVKGKVEPGLVDITAALKYQRETAKGTGMLMSASGLVLTNNHVIDGATEVRASLAAFGGRTYPARVLGYDREADVALLQLTGAPNWATVSFGDSSQVSVGTPVLALGDAQGRGGITPAAGDISGLDRSIRASDEGSGTTEDLNHMLQINAEIQQGDSGGALADSAGQVIGMVTAAHSGSGGQPSGTMGFAIPIDTALIIARQIAAGQASSAVSIGLPGFLGVDVAQSNSANPRQQGADSRQPRVRQAGAACVVAGQEPGVPAKIAPAGTGALIMGVLCGSAAQSKGLVPGDVITSVNGQPVTTAGALTAITARYHPGEMVSIGWRATNGSRHTTSITLGAGPARLAPLAVTARP
jgi:S1-C subfamily serine protease